MGNGISPDHWWAKGAGADMQLGKSLEPLEPVKAKINVIHGLFNKTATGLGIHPPMTGNLLSGVPIQKGAIIHGGISVDQMLAKHVGQGDGAGQHGPGLRAADDRVSRDEFLQRLRLAHLLAERGFARPQRDLPFAGVRQPVSRIAAASATSASWTG